MKKLALVLALIIVLSGCGGFGKKNNVSKMENNMPERKMEEQKDIKEEPKQEEKEEPKQEEKEEPKQEEKQEEKSSVETASEEAIDLSGAYLESGVSGDGRNEENRSKAIELNRWARVGKYSTQSKVDEEVFLRITKVTPQSEDAEALKKRLAIHNELKKDYGGYDLSELKIPEDVELCLVEYDLYIPKNFPSSEGGMAEPNVSLYVQAVKGGGIPSKDGSSSYIGLGSVNKLDYDGEFKDRRGQVYHGYAFFAMVKDYKDYVIEYGSMPIGDNSENAKLLYHFFKPY